MLFMHNITRAVNVPLRCLMSNILAVATDYNYTHKTLNRLTLILVLNDSTVSDRLKICGNKGIWVIEKSSDSAVDGTLEYTVDFCRIPTYNFKISAKPLE